MLIWLIVLIVLSYIDIVSKPQKSLPLDPPQMNDVMSKMITAE